MLAKFLGTQNYEKSMLYSRFNHGHTKSTFLEVVTNNPYSDGNVFTIKLWLKTTKNIAFVWLRISTLYMYHCNLGHYTGPPATPPLKVLLLVDVLRPKILTHLHRLCLDPNYGINARFTICFLCLMCLNH